jgi:hypothetical protein
MVLPAADVCKYRMSSAGDHGHVLTLHVLREGACERARHARHNRAGQQIHVAHRLQSSVRKYDQHSTEGSARSNAGFLQQCGETQ